MLIRKTLMALSLATCLAITLPVPAPGDGPANTKEASSIPMFIREAKQPAGFPESTPVGQIRVKEYPAYRSAAVSNKGRQQNSMFRTLFQHIKKNEIAMTAPVEMTYDENGPETMAFLYASVETGSTGEDGAVEVVDVPATKVVAIGVRGSYTKERFEKHRDLLTKWLAEHSDQWTKAGKPRHFAFNSPFVPGPMKYGEVQIPIRRVAGKDR